MNECATCGLDFGSLNAFDKHRVGVHEYTYSEGVKMTPMWENGRRCLTEQEIEELRAGGSPVFARNTQGRWSIARELEKARELKYGASKATHTRSHRGCWCAIASRRRAHRERKAARVSDTTIDPVCLIHGKRWSEHPGGSCLYCCLCFSALTPEECWQDEHGDKWDMCLSCGQQERRAKEAAE